jgi:hypothetical protein
LRKRAIKKANAAYRARAPRPKPTSINDAQRPKVKVDRDPKQNAGDADADLPTPITIEPATNAPTRGERFIAGFCAGVRAAIGWIKRVFCGRSSANEPKIAEAPGGIPGDAAPAGVAGRGGNDRGGRDAGGGFGAEDAKRTRKGDAGGGDERPREGADGTAPVLRDPVAELMARMAQDDVPGVFEVLASFESVDFPLPATAAVPEILRQGATPLHAAAYFGAVDCIAALIAAGADPRALDRAWQPMAFFARDRPAVRALLVARGLIPRELAQIDVHSGEFWTPENRDALVAFGRDGRWADAVQELGRLFTEAQLRSIFDLEVERRSAAAFTDGELAILTEFVRNGGVDVTDELFAQFSGSRTRAAVENELLRLRGVFADAAQTEDLVFEDINARPELLAREMADCAHQHGHAREELLVRVPEVIQPAVAALLDLPAVVAAAEIMPEEVDAAPELIGVAVAVVDITPRPEEVDAPQELFVAIAVVDATPGSEVDAALDVIGDEATENQGRPNEFVVAPEHAEIPDGAFESSDVTKVTTHGGVWRIGCAAFRSCAQLAELVLPEGLEVIGVSAFEECSALKAVTFPSSLRTIGEAAFSRCYGLETVAFTAGVTSIGDEAFFNCSSLRIESLPPTLKTLGTAAFGDCTSLTKMQIPASLSLIPEGAFHNCSQLVELTMLSGVTAINARAFSYSQVGRVDFPDSLQWVGDYAFEHCTNLGSVRFAAKIGRIGVGAFAGCAKLDAVDVSAVVNLNSRAFANCTTLRSVRLAPTAMGDDVFDGCGALEDVAIEFDEPMKWSIEDLGDLTRMFYGVFEPKKRSVPDAEFTLFLAAEALRRGDEEFLVTLERSVPKLLKQKVTRRIPLDVGVVETLRHRQSDLLSLVVTHSFGPTQLPIAGDAEIVTGTREEEEDVLEPTPGQGFIDDADGLTRMIRTQDGYALVDVLIAATGVPDPVLRFHDVDVMKVYGVGVLRFSEYCAFHGHESRLARLQSAGVAIPQSLVDFAVRGHQQGLMPFFAGCNLIVPAQTPPPPPTSPFDGFFAAIRSGDTAQACAEATALGVQHGKCVIAYASTRHFETTVLESLLKAGEQTARLEVFWWALRSGCLNAVKVCVKLGCVVDGRALTEALSAECVDLETVKFVIAKFKPKPFHFALALHNGRLDVAKAVFAELGAAKPDAETLTNMVIGAGAAPCLRWDQLDQRKATVEEVQFFVTADNYPMLMMLMKADRLPFPESDLLESCAREPAPRSVIGLSYLNAVLDAEIDTTGLADHVQSALLCAPPPEPKETIRQVKSRVTTMRDHIDLGLDERRDLTNGQAAVRNRRMMAEAETDLARPMIVTGAARGSARVAVISDEVSFSHAAGILFIASTGERRIYPVAGEVDAEALTIAHVAFAIEMGELHPEGWDTRRDGHRSLTREALRELRRFGMEIRPWPPRMNDAAIIEHMMKIIRGVLLRLRFSSKAEVHARMISIVNAIPKAFVKNLFSGYNRGEYFIALGLGASVLQCVPTTKGKTFALPLRGDIRGCEEDALFEPKVAAEIEMRLVAKEAPRKIGRRFNLAWSTMQMILFAVQNGFHVPEQPTVGAVCLAIVSYAPGQVTMVYHCKGPAVHLAMLCELRANATLRCAALTYLVQKKKPSLIGELLIGGVRHFAFAMDPREDIFKFTVPFEDFGFRVKTKFAKRTLPTVAFQPQFAEFPRSKSMDAVAPSWWAPSWQLTDLQEADADRQFTTEPNGITYKNLKMAFVEDDPPCAVIAIDCDLPRMPGFGCTWIGRGAELRNIGRASKLEASVPDARRAEWDAAQPVIRDADGGCGWFADFANRMLLSVLCGDGAPTDAALARKFLIPQPTAFRHRRDVIESAILPILATADEPAYLVARRALVAETLAAHAPLWSLRQRLAIATKKIRRAAVTRSLSADEVVEWTLVAQSFITAQGLLKATDPATIASRIANEDPRYPDIDAAGIIAELAKPDVGPVLFDDGADADADDAAPEEEEEDKHEEETKEDVEGEAEAEEEDDDE